MARATYIQPTLNDWLEKFHFFTDVKVRYCETDMSGHANCIPFIKREKRKKPYTTSLVRINP